MSHENVEVVRAFFEAWNAGNTDAVVELLDADVDYFPSRKLPEARPCHGPEEVLRFIARYPGVWPHGSRAVPLEVGSGVLEYGVPLAPVDRSNNGTHDLDVLLRHRPRSIPQAY